MFSLRGKSIYDETWDAAYFTRSVRICSKGHHGYEQLSRSSKKKCLICVLESEDHWHKYPFRNYKEWLESRNGQNK